MSGKTTFRWFGRLLLVTLALPLAATEARAQTATQTVTFQVDTIKAMSASGDPGKLVVNSATAGSSPDDATDNSTSWAVTTNLSNTKVTGSIDTNMPSGVTLTVSLAAPSGASSSGDISLSTTDQDLVTGVSQVAESGLTITYTLSATTGAGVVAEDTRTVTFTLLEGS